MDWLAAQAAEPLSVPGLPGVAEASNKVVNEGGLLGALLILAIAAIIALTVAILRMASNNQKARDEAQEARDKERDDAAKELHALNNQRFVEMREVVVALNTNTAALNVISQQMADRTATSQQMADNLRELILIGKSNAGALEEIRRVVYGQPNDNRPRASGGL